VKKEGNSVTVPFSIATYSGSVSSEEVSNPAFLINQQTFIVFQLHIMFTCMHVGTCGFIAGSKYIRNALN
jgi:hypothetical protein